jgi:hypothetical protein
MSKSNNRIKIPSSQTFRTYSNLTSSYFVHYYLRSTVVKDRAGLSFRDALSYGKDEAPVFKQRDRRLND